MKMIAKLQGKKSTSLLMLFLIFLGNLCLGVLLWWLAAGMDTMVEQAANIEFWGHMLVRELLALIRGSNGHVPMTLGGEEEKIELTSYSIDTIPTSLMEGQGQVEGGRQELDLNQSADPEITLNYAYKRSVQVFSDLISRMSPQDKERVFPHYKRGVPIKQNIEIQAAIADFLKQRDASTLGSDSAELVAFRKKSHLYKDFTEYQVKKQNRAVE